MHTNECTMYYDTTLESKKKFGVWGVKVVIGNFEKIYTSVKYKTSHEDLMVLGLGRMIRYYGPKTQVTVVVRSAYLHEACLDDAIFDYEEYSFLKSAAHKEFFQLVKQYNINVVYQPEITTHHRELFGAVSTQFQSMLAAHKKFVEKKPRKPKEKAKRHKRFSKT